MTNFIYDELFSLPYIHIFKIVSTWWWWWWWSLETHFKCVHNTYKTWRNWVAHPKLTTHNNYEHLGMKPGLRIRRGGSIKKNHYESPNKHQFSSKKKHTFSINKLLTKTKMQNYCFLIHYNAVIYENGIRLFFFLYFFLCLCLCVSLMYAAG